MTEDTPVESHHAGLTNYALRSFVAQEQRRAYANVGLHGSTEMRAVYADAVKAAEEKLKDYDMGVALRVILDKFGWDLHDVSDRVTYDEDTYRHFIGTDEEFKQIYGDIGEEE